MAIPPDKLSIGRALLAGGPVTQEMLQRELQSSNKGGGVLGKALLQSGFPTEEQLIGPLLGRLRIPRINAKNTKIPLETIRLIPEEIAIRSKVLPLDKIGNILIVVTPDVGNVAGMGEVRQRTGLTVFPIQSDPKACSDADFDAIVRDYYKRLSDSGMQPMTMITGAPDDQAASNGALKAIPAGSLDEDHWFKRYGSSGPVPADEVLM